MCGEEGERRGDRDVCVFLSFFMFLFCASYSWSFLVARSIAGESETIGRLGLNGSTPVLW